MNIRQRKLVANIVIVLFFTIAMIVGFANIKDKINRSESIRAMELLGKEVLQYRKDFGSLPNESYILQIKEKIGAVRLGQVQYRAAWIEYGSPPETTILAYAKKDYSGFSDDGYVVLWLDGRVEWNAKEKFEKILTEQQKQLEIQWLQEHLRNERKF